MLSSIEHAQPLLSLGAALNDVVTWRQVEEVEAVEKGLATDAQRFFVLTQTDNMWKEHLQVRTYRKLPLHITSLLHLSRLGVSPTL